MEQNDSEENINNKVNKKQIVKLKTLDSQKIQFKSNTSSIIDMLPIRSYSSKFPVQFVPRLCPMKSKIVPTPLKLNKNKDTKIKQLSDDEAGSSELLSSSSSSDIGDNLENNNNLQQSINDSSNVTKDQINELPKEKISEEINDKSARRKLSIIKYSNAVEATIQEFENEDKDLSDNEENNLRINEINKEKKNLFSPLNDISPIDKKLDLRNRFSSDTSDFVLDEGNEDKKDNIETHMIEFDRSRNIRHNTIKDLRKRMIRIKTKTIEVKSKETIDFIHKNLKKDYDFEKSSNENVIVVEKKDNNSKNEQNSFSIKKDEIPGRKKSLTILEMLSFTRKFKK